MFAIRSALSPFGRDAGKRLEKFAPIAFRIVDTPHLVASSAIAVETTML
jgi:hypothetical protein